MRRFAYKHVYSTAFTRALSLLLVFWRIPFTSTTIAPEGAIQTSITQYYHVEHDHHAVAQSWLFLSTHTHLRIINSRNDQSFHTLLNSFFPAYNSELNIFKSYSFTWCIWKKKNIERFQAVGWMNEEKETRGIPDGSQRRQPIKPFCST